MNNKGIAETHQYAGLMLRHADVGLALFDAQDFRLLRSNPYFQQILDANPDPRWQNGQTIGHSFHDWMPPSIAANLDSTFRQVAATGIAYRGGEYILFDAHRQPTYWSWNLDGLRDKDGRVVNLLMNCRNVTKHVRARQRVEATQASLTLSNRALETERERLTIVGTVARSVRESLNLEIVGKATIETLASHFDPRSVFIYTAEPLLQGLRMLDYFLISSIAEVQQVLSHTQFIAFDSPFLISRLSKQRDPMIIEDALDPRTKGTIAEVNPVLIEDMRGYICVPLWYYDHFEGVLSATFNRVIQTDGIEAQTLTGCAVHIAAALAHARLHAEVENERARLRTVLDQMPEGILIVELPANTISYTNPAAAHLLDRPLQDLIGSSYRAHIGNQHTPNTQREKQPPQSLPQLIERAAQGEIISSIETVIQRHDGSMVTYLSSYAPLQFADGSIKEMMIVFYDITRQKSIEQQKKEFLSIASHELRTPITAIMGFAEIIQIRVNQGNGFDKVNQRALLHIREQSEQLTRLIEELLDVNSIENARLQLHPALHNLVETLNNVIENQSIISHEHSITLVLADLEQPGVLTSFYDEKRLIQVFNNLLSNARKYSPASSAIEVGLQIISNQPPTVLIWVKDQGIGIPFTELPYIFERFYRAGNLDHSISGLGLGLYLVKELITLHGGHIWVRSQEGRGSTFFISLPLNGKDE